MIEKRKKKRKKKGEWEKWFHFTKVPLIEFHLITLPGLFCTCKVARTFHFCHTEKEKKNLRKIHLGVYLKIKYFKGVFIQEGCLIKRDVYFKMHKFRKQKRTFSGTCSNRTSRLKLAWRYLGNISLGASLGKWRECYATSCKK